MNWIMLGITTAIFYGAYNVFIKLSSGHIHQIVGAVVLQVVAAILGGGVLLCLKLAGSSFAVSQKGIWYAILAGAFVGLAEIFSFIVFSRGLSVSVGAPIIIGGSVAVGALLGILFLREHLSLIQYLAIVLIIIGIGILSARAQ